MNVLSNPDEPSFQTPFPMCIFLDQRVLLDLLQRVVGLLESEREGRQELQETLQIQGSVLNNIWRHLSGGNVAAASSGRPPSGAVLPLSTMDDFRRLEGRLTSDTEFTEALVSCSELTNFG